MRLVGVRFIVDIVAILRIVYKAFDKPNTYVN